MSACVHTPESRASSLTADKLRKRYIIALSLIALLTIASQGVIQWLISDQEFDSRVVNIAGRQRMLSQKITKTAFYVGGATDADSAAAYRDQIGQAAALWERSHLGLQHGDAELGLPGRNSGEVSTLFRSIEPYHQAMLSAAKSLLAASGQGRPIAQYLEALRENEPFFLEGMDEIVFRYDQEAKHKVALARWLELGLMIITLLVLALEAVFIFAPVVRRIRGDMRTLEKKEQDMSRLFSVSPTAMLLIDNRDFTIRHANEKATELLGIPAALLSGKSLFAYLDKQFDINELFFKKISHNEFLNDYEIVLISVQNAIINALVSVREIHFADQDVFVLGITNISELKKAQESLEYFATYDEMTGLVNRRTGLMILESEMARCRRDHGELTVCFADLDGLKTTNDQFGHAAGDWLLQTAARAFTRTIRAGDVAVRLGGDEFLLIFHNCPKQETENLLARIEDFLVRAGQQENKPFPLGVSFGVTAYAPDRHGTADDLIAEADALMYQVKQERKRKKTG